MASPPPQDSAAPLLTLSNISLDYGRFNALKNIHFALGSSTVHAIVGEHGAGKSSLAMILAGVLKPQTGIISFDRKHYRFFTLKQARQLGIAVVHQHMLSLHEHFNVAENLFFSTGPFFQKTAGPYQTIKNAHTFLQRHEIDINPLSLVGDLNLSDRILIEILKHLTRRPKLLILDEALEKLSSSSLKKMMTILMDLQREGMSILLISHRLDDIYHLADCVSILRNGEVLLTDELRKIDRLNLIKMAYMQISAEQHVDDLQKEFHQFLKYDEAILRHLPVNLIVIDPECRIKMVNDFCKQSFSLNNTSYFNTPLTALVSSSNEEVLRSIQQAHSRDGEKTLYQVPISINDTAVICNFRTFPIYDGTIVIGSIVILEDMTEHDRLQKQVILSEKLASVGLLAAGVAHEINNPLEIIYTYMSFMKYKFRSPEYHEALDTLQEHISHIASIVSNLLSFSEKNTIANEEIELNDEIRAVLNLIQHNAAYKHIRIQFNPCGHDLLIQANKHEIKQVILNLLKNSFEAMPSGGRITIDTRGLEENDRQLVQVEFKDTGPGLGDQGPDNIFLPFYSTKKGSTSNIGLGLSVSYGIIQKYHGALSAENIDSGCRFTITLPCAVQAASRDDQPCYMQQKAERLNGEVGGPALTSSHTQKR